MAFHRPYRAALGIDKALTEIVRGKGRLFDPEVVKACLAVFKGSRYQFDSEVGSHPKATNTLMC